MRPRIEVPMGMGTIEVPMDLRAAIEAFLAKRSFRLELWGAGNANTRRPTDEILDLDRKLSIIVVATGVPPSVAIKRNYTVSALARGVRGHEEVRDALYDALTGQIKAIFNDVRAACEAAGWRWGEREWGEHGREAV